MKKKKTEEVRPLIAIGPFPEGPKIGDRVKITDLKSTYYGREGVVVRKGNRGGFYILHEDGEEVYHPWGYEKIRSQ